LSQHVQGLLGETGPDVARVLQAAGALDTDEQRAEQAGPPPFAWLPASDHDLLAAEVLDLQPAARPLARLVTRRQAFGNDALQAVLAGHGLHVGASLAGERGRCLPARALEGESLQQRPPRVVGLVAPR